MFVDLRCKKSCLYVQWIKSVCMFGDLFACMFLGVVCMSGGSPVLGSEMKTVLLRFVIVTSLKVSSMWQKSVQHGKAANSFSFKEWYFYKEEKTIG